MMNQTHRAVLQILFSMATADRHADLALVAEELGQSCSETARILDELDAAGLANAETVRLTMSGLVLATSLRRVRRPPRPATRPERVRARRRSAWRAA